MAVKNGPSTGGSGEYVTIYSKLQQNLVLQLCQFETVDESVIGGKREIKVGRKFGETYVIRGVAEYRGLDRNNWTPPLLVHGYAVTRNIPRDFWEKWCAQNHDNDALNAGFLIAVTNDADGAAQTREHEGQATGHEPLSVGANQPVTDPRIKSIAQGLRIESAPENGKRI